MNPALFKLEYTSERKKKINKRKYLCTQLNHEFVSALHSLGHTLNQPAVFTLPSYQSVPFTYANESRIKKNKIKK